MIEKRSWLFYILRLAKGVKHMQDIRKDNLKEIRERQEKRFVDYLKKGMELKQQNTKEEK